MINFDIQKSQNKITKDQIQELLQPQGHWLQNTTKFWFWWWDEPTNM